MKKRRRTKITIERERLWVVATLHGQRTGWCEACRSEVEMVGADAAAALTGLSQRAVFRLIEAGRLHFSETLRGAPLICLNSLLEHLSARESPALEQVEDDPE